MSEVSQVKQRSAYLDVIKGVAIILVVLAHCIQFGSGEQFYIDQQCFSDPLFSFIYGFHMPLFMIVSGFLFWNSVNKHSNGKVAVSRLKSLQVPIVVWQTVYLILLYLSGQITLSSSLVYSYRGALWFLWSVLICSMIVLVGRVCFKDSILFCLLVCVLLLFVPDQYLSSLHVFMFPYFVAGYYWNRYGMRNRYNSLSHEAKWMLCGGSFVGFLLFYFLYDAPERSIYLNGTCLLGRASVGAQLLIDMARYCYGLLGVSMVMILIDQLLPYLKESVIGKSLVELGKISLGIYVINHYTYDLMLLLPISSNYVYMLTILETVITMMFIYWTIKLIERSRYISLLLLGKG